MVARKKTGHGGSKSTAPSTPTSGEPTGPASANSSSETVFFWHPTEPTTGFLSQWYHSPFHSRSNPPIEFPTAEHYMMYQKAMLFNDQTTATSILAAEHPAQVKAFGRAVTNFDDNVWKRERCRIVREANWCKFSLPVTPFEEMEVGEEYERVHLRDALLATGHRQLVEASPSDRIWGIGFKGADAGRNRNRWGLNLLGKCLMEVREQLRREDEEKEEVWKVEEKGG